LGDNRADSRCSVPIAPHASGMFIILLIITVEDAYDTYVVGQERNDTSMVKIIVG
jgi:hypothetical protein